MKRISDKIVLAIVIVILTVGCSRKNDLSACDEKRDKIEEKYGITICYGDDKLEGEAVSELELCDDPNKIDGILDEIDEYFSKLPKGFVDELTSMIEGKKTNIYVVISKEQYIGVSFKTEGTEYWIINEKEAISPLAENTMYSIVYRMVHSDEIASFMPNWKEYNPKSFEYGERVDNKKYLYGVSSNNDCYFITEESMKDVVKEMLLLFAILWDDTTMQLYNIADLPKIDAKLKYLCSELDRVFETVDENAYWARYIK